MTPLVAKQLIDDVIVRVDGAENVREFFRQSTPNLLSHQTLSCLGRKEPYVSGDKRYGPGLPAIPKCRRRTNVVGGTNAVDSVARSGKLFSGQ
jgi:hypothetical protein